MTVGRKDGAKSEGICMLYNRMKEAGADFFLVCICHTQGKSLKLNASES